MVGANLQDVRMNMVLELDIPIEYLGRTPLKQMRVSNILGEDKGGNACKTSFRRMFFYLEGVKIWKIKDLTI